MCDASRALGNSAMSCVVIVWRCVALWTSTSGLCPETRTVSSICPTRNSALTVAVKPAVSSIPSRLTVLNPGSANVTAYTPGLRLMIL